MIKYEKIFGGIVDDVSRRLPYYWSDWTTFNPKILSSSLYIFLASMAPALTFALHLEVGTQRSVGVLEVLLSSFICSSIVSMIAGQPLTIVGVTGPVMLLSVAMYTMASSARINFLPFYAWSQIWAAIFHWILAALNACNYVKYFTRFSCEIFGAFVAAIFISTGITGIVDNFNTTSRSDNTIALSLLELILSLGTAGTCVLFSNAKYWKITTTSIRTFLSDYAATLAVILWSLISYTAQFSDSLRNLNVPTLFVPTTFGTTSGRAWVVLGSSGDSSSDISTAGIFYAIIPGLIITILFYFDHNISGIFAQIPDPKSHSFELPKGKYFHLDFFVLGVGLFVTGALGLPPCNGMM